jgi:hypothetical protein
MTEVYMRIVPISIPESALAESVLVEAALPESATARTNAALQQ